MFPNLRKGMSFALRRNVFMVLVAILLAAACLTPILVVQHKKNATSHHPYHNGVETKEAIMISPMQVAKTKAYRCKEPRSYDGSFRSQRREDKILLREYFDQICGGTYIEMGGFDGEKFSNSYLFHKALDWNGVLVEASPINYAKMIENRPNETANVNAGVCAEERDLHWVSMDLEKGAVSGFTEFAAASFKRAWWTDELIKNATIVRCRTLKNILHETVGDHFHFDIFSLDVEGAEYEALKSIDFELVSFGVILVEADNHDKVKNENARTILTKNGYKPVYNYTLQASEWFVNENFEAIYEDIKK